jgi:hypothetical protein
VGEIRSIDIFEKELEVIITESESNLSKLEPTESNLSELNPVTTKKSRKPRMTKAKMIELEYEKYCDREALMT